MPTKKTTKVAPKVEAPKQNKVEPLVGGGINARPEDLYTKLNEVIAVINK